MTKDAANKMKMELEKEIKELYTDILKELCAKKDYLSDSLWQAIERLLHKPAIEYYISDVDFEFQFAKIDYAYKDEDDFIENDMPEEEMNDIFIKRENEFYEQTKHLKEMIERHEKIKHDIAFRIDRLTDTEMEFDGDIIITDPCYVVKDNDWSKCGYGSCMEVLGFTKHMTRSTLYGDWSCATYDLDTKEVIGGFCADAGLVSVMLLDEVMKYNPDYKDVENNHWCVTCIRDFKGKVEFRVTHLEGTYEDTTDYHKAGDKWEDDIVEVYGYGINKTTGKPINFVGTQNEF